MTKVLFESGKFWLELDGEKIKLIYPEFIDYNILQEGESMDLPKGFSYTLTDYGDGNKIAILSPH